MPDKGRDVKSPSTSTSDVSYQRVREILGYDGRHCCMHPRG